MKAVVAAFNQEKALVGAFSVITNLRMELFEALTQMVAQVFEMPWILNTAWKIIKSLLPPPAVARIKFVTKSNIKVAPCHYNISILTSSLCRRS